MAKFIDKKGREWEVDITFGDLEKIKDVCGVDLTLGIDAAQLAQTVFGNPASFGKMMFVLVEDQANEKGVSPEEFAKGFNLATIESATAAFLESFTNFFLRSPAAAAKAIEKLGKAREMASNAATELMEAEAEKVLSSLAGKSAESLASLTQGHTS